ncbi:MAG: gamma-glutamyl-gamma-aminobutyrate hydrolase family protein [Planctomycetales bacterium]|nr:gamma-glutamyl-gamma-aminobutyrate hydrolase family protein [Planctomycetales bacterium]
MQNKPLVGINADFRAAKGDPNAYLVLAAGYFDCVSQVGAIPVILPPTGDEDDINRLLDQLDAVVLVGGNDLNPRNDGFMVHPSMKLMEERRENFDRRLMRAIAQRRTPVFGIGAGMQLMNVTLGGSLFYHLPIDVPEAMPHRDAQDPAHRHSLVVEANSIMERVYGDGEIRVNSRHHMAIDEVAEAFRVTARCPDGVIEAIESASQDWLALGTQFHPESPYASALEIRIFEEFVDALREQGAEQIRLVA